jgi:endo-1,4-beta-xylanase
MRMAVEGSRDGRGLGRFDTASVSRIARGGALLLLLLVALGSGPCQRPESGVSCADPADCRLHEAAAVAGVRFGFHDENGAGGPDGELAAREGNALTNHGVSWASLQPTRDTVSESMDANCAFSTEHDLFQVGFHFAWNQLLLDDLADWVLEIDDPAELEAVMRERVRIIFDRCPGIDRLDVINEPLGTLNGTALHRSHFYRVFGPGYIARLFQIVDEEAPPHVELFLNENFVEYSRPRAEAWVALVRDLVEAGAPVDAVGIQTHLLLGEPDFALFREILESIAALGVRVFVSELDVPVPVGLEDRFAVQAERYRRVVETCLAVPACDLIIVWGIDDAHTWLHGFDLLTGPDPDPLLFDEHLLPKPAYFAVRDALLRGRAGDHPVSGERLSLRRRWLGGTLLTLSSNDAGVVSPSPASRNDPRREDSDDASVELLLPGGARHVVVVPAGAGWQVHDGYASYWGGLLPWLPPGSEAPPIWLELREGGGLDLTLWDSPISPAEASGGLGVRITLGTLRICADFGAATITGSSSRRVVATDAAARDGVDCSSEWDPD